MKSKKVIILGGIGNGSVIANAIVDANIRGNKEYIFIGYLNDREEKGSLIEGFPVLGKINEIKTFIDKGYYFINTIYRIDGQQERIKMFESLNIPDSQLAIFVHPTAYVAPSVELGPGTVIMPLVAISPATKFGRCCLVMVSVTIGHDNNIGDHCHFAAQSCVGSYLKIEEGVHIGLNATIRENLILSKHSTLGMGAVLTKNMGEKEIWAGNPAKFLRMAD